MVPQQKPSKEDNMRLVKNCRVEALFNGSWVPGRYLCREQGEMEVQTFQNGSIQSRTVKYDRRHVLLDSGIQYATSKDRIRRV